MEFAWKDDEGLDIEWRRIKERYGVEVDYEKAKHELPERIRIIHREMDGFEFRKGEVRKRVEALKIAIADKEAIIKERGEFLAKQKAYYEVEKREDFLAKIQEAERTIEAGRAEIRQNEAVLVDLISAPEPSFDLSELERTAKTLSHIMEACDCRSEWGLLPPRRKLQTGTLSPADCIAILDARKVALSEILYYDGKVVLGEADYARTEWEEFAREAMDLSRWLLGKKDYAAINGRLFSWINKSLMVKIAGCRVGGAQEDQPLRIAFVQPRKSTKHPLFSQFEVRLPHDFILFNDSVWIECEFACSSLGMTSAILDIDDDDD